MTAINELDVKGLVVLDMPPKLKQMMLLNVTEKLSMGLKVNAKHDLQGLVKDVGQLSDEAFRKLIPKTRRFIDGEAVAMANKFVSSIGNTIFQRRAHVSLISNRELRENISLSPTTLDFFWRLVRRGKNDVGQPHSDAQFWDLLKGTDAEPRFSHPYRHRWKLWVPLANCDGQNALRLLPSSHQMNVPYETRLTEHGLKPTIASEWVQEHQKDFICPIVKFDSQCILFHDRIVHFGPLNETTSARISAECTILI